jgi:glutamate carboxypeptidase
MPRVPSAARSLPPTASALAVRDAAADGLDVLLADLARWVDRDTPSLDLEAVDGFARELAGELQAYGYEPELVPSPAGLHVHARLRGPGRARVALVCHHDTVFPRGTAAARPFRRDGDRVLGPGVADMKGGLAVAVHAGRLLAEHGLPVGLVELVSIPDEEPRSAPFATLERLRGFDAALVLECGRPGNGVVCARKGGRWLELRASGRSAHAGTEPEQGRNAVLALCAEALRITQLDGAREGLGVQVTRLHGGEVINSIPGSASLSLDVRAWRTADLDWAIGELQRYGAHDGVALELETTEATPPLEAAASAALAGAAEAIAAGLGAPVVRVETGGASDGCWTAGAGIPTLDGLGPIGACDHTPDEYAEVASFPYRCGLVAGLVAAVEEGLQ